MNITIALNAEQQFELDDMLAKYNGTQETPVDAPAYLSAVIIGIINEKVDRRITERGQKLIENSKRLPLEDRLALIAQIESQISA